MSDLKPVVEKDWMHRHFISNANLYSEAQVDALESRITQLEAENAALKQALTEIDGCFEAALVEGWIEAMADGDIDRIRDIYNRRIHFIREILLREAGKLTKE